MHTKWFMQKVMKFFALLLVSDRCAQGQAEDLSGKLLAKAVVSDEFPGVVVSEECVPDEIAVIKVSLLSIFGSQKFLLTCSLL